MSQIAAAVARAFQPSPFQEAIFDWVSNGTGSAVVLAVAGSGKTTTLIKALCLMSGDIFFGAFNKKIAEEIERKAANVPNVTVSTMHAAGFRTWRKVARDVKVNNWKCRDIFREVVGRSFFHGQFEGPVLALVSYAKQACVGIKTPIESSDAWYNLVEHFDLDCLEDEFTVVDLAKKVLVRSNERCAKEVDFDDMIYAPLFFKARPQEYDWVLIDEAQDTNRARRMLALAMLKSGGRLIAVGDPRQNIYGFTGADSDALDQITSAVNAIHLPLTVSYRCPKAVVAEARKHVDHIEAHEDAIEGTVDRIHIDNLVADAKAGDAILSRFNAPLMDLVYRFIAEGRAAKIEGRDIASGLKALTRRWKVKSAHALMDKLDEHLDREVTKFRAKEKEVQAVAVEDRVACVKLLIGRVMKTSPGCSDIVAAVCSEVDRIFGEDVGNDCVLLSTLHKSKGREFDNVFILDTGVAKWARKEWEQISEVNCIYVGITRAMKRLTWVTLNSRSK